MYLAAEHIGDLFLILMLLFGFNLIVYVNAEYLSERKDEDED